VDKCIKNNGLITFSGMSPIKGKPQRPRRGTIIDYAALAKGTRETTRKKGKKYF
jgi:hypothetical protein